jgi:hypothetical protein
MAQVNFKYKNGDTLRDTLSGLEGTTVASTIWLNGCIRYFIQPRGVKDGKPIEASSFDEQQLEPVVIAEKAQDPAIKPGGPYPDPK